VADGHKFSAVRCLSSRLLDRSKKNAIYATPPAFGAPDRVIPSEFRRDFVHHKTGVLGIWCSAVCEIICLAVLIQLPACDGRTDGETDGHAMRVDIALASRG